jgi:murein DD-endopeptidase MepM/ murein hydrolase activator NlpD
LNFSSKSSGKSSKGFYIALGVCLIAVGAAAWTTYDSVTNNMEPQASSSQAQAQNANNTVSGIFVTESSEPASSASVSSAPASSAPVSSAPASSAPASSAVSSKPAAKQTAAQGTVFSMPVSGKVTQGFSKVPVFCKTLGDYRAHTGVDLSAKTGEAVKAVAEGVVTKVSNDGINGNTIVIKHGSIEASYCGLDKMLVKEKQSVKRGQQIGTVGVDPMESAEGPHLRLVMTKNGQYIDPMSVLK